MTDKTINDQALDTLFREARTIDNFEDRPVPGPLLQQIYELARMAPTSANCQPMRILFLTSPESRDRLAPALSSTNREKSLRAPVTAVIAYDLAFPGTLSKLYRVPGAEHWFAGDAMIQETAFRNSSLQGAYVILAARSLGLDVAPMSGFDNNQVDEEFFSGGIYKTWRSNFICNLGYGDMSSLPPRDPRPDFADACAVL
ncbi:MAG: malonic semialdehyde reductase [Rhodospirillaceae bacterium]|nr:malonic semialdehyde reductase [Rhodospirillaceae bacterium]MBT5457204.1 malonic semialdehyde reductase [Rhodospirillaceae bacterium]